MIVIVLETALLAARDSYNLGLLYDSGVGGDRDLKKARELFLKAAALGNPRAMFAVGWTFEQGHGVNVDMVEWYDENSKESQPEREPNSRLQCSVVHQSSQERLCRCSRPNRQASGRSVRVAARHQCHAARLTDCLSSLLSSRRRRRRCCCCCCIATDNKVPWRTEFYRLFPASVKHTVETLLTLALVDRSSMRVLFPEAPLWMLPPEILHEVFSHLLDCVPEDSIKIDIESTEQPDPDDKASS